MAIMDPTKTPGSTDTIQCPEGQVFYGGACVDRNSLQALQTAGGLSGTQAKGTAVMSPPQTAQNTTNTQLQDAFGAIRSSLEGTAQANIEASRAQTEANQQELARQLELQRQDYLKNRQNLQKETFLRGRNVLANLANRGLATSGLQQLGDVQRTIATGQQMNELSRAFENARQGLTSQQQAASRAQTAFEAQQQTGLAQQLASTGLQEIQMTGTEKERSVAYAESLATLLADPNIPQATKDTLAPLYEQLITTLPQTTEGGNITEALGANQIQNQYDPIILAQKISGYSGVELSDRENSQLNDYLKGSKYFEEGSDLLVALQTNKGKEATFTQNKRAGAAGLNDTFDVVFPDGKTAEIGGRELITLVMSGDIKLTKEQAIEIAKGKDGSIMTAGTLWGDRWDAFAKPYLQWLEDQGYIEKNKGGSGGDVSLGSRTSYRVID